MIYREFRFSYKSPAMRRFFITPGQAASPSPTLTGQDAQHIRTVLRLKPGQQIELLDGTGMAYAAEIEALASDGVKVRIMRRKPQQAESPTAIILAQAMLKDKKMDILVRQLTELGITQWVPFFSARAIPRPNADRLEHRVARWVKISHEAVKQCRRNQPPAIHAPLRFDQTLGLAADCQLKLLFWEEESTPLKKCLPAAPSDFKKIMIVLGPEGGFTASEVHQARAAGFAVASLGPRILRAETAALAACTLMQFVLGDLG
jgi:16S rRNA (uracil1498-N3)-methyltransferase